MPKKSAREVPADKLELYEKLVATNPDVERKGASMPYTSLNGHMFSFVTPDGTLALRLPTGEREAFLKKFKTRLCERHGRVLQEYVEVPAALLRKTQELKTYFDLSVAYVGSLQPKSTARQKTVRKAQPRRSPPGRKRAK